MKYGYMNYRKHLLENRKERPMNIGDPIQSFAALEVYKRMGVPEDQIVPLDRYDLADYEGEDILAIINGPETYEHFAYHTRYLPFSKNIHPIFIGLHLHRNLSDVELQSLRDNQPIGCRDEYTVNYLTSKGIDAFLSGCLTMLFPKRSQNKDYDKIFIVDCSEETESYIPDSIKRQAEYLTQVIRMKSNSKDDRLTIEETEQYNSIAREQLYRYRDEAKLVITSRLHVATPCAAMGIPVVLVRDTYDERYQFIDRFLPLYKPSDLEKLDWEHIEAHIPENAKNIMIEMCKNMLGMAKAKMEMRNMYSHRIQEFDCKSEEAVAASKLPFEAHEKFNYCIWGVCMPNSYLLYEQMQLLFPNSKLKYAIDTYATGIYQNNTKIIHPEKMDDMIDDHTWILVVAPAAHSAAYDKLIGKYNFALIKGCKCDIYTKET